MKIWWYIIGPLPESIEKVEKKTKPSDDQDVIKEPLEEQPFVDQHAKHQIPEDQAEIQTPKNQNQNGGSQEIQRNANSREVKHKRLVLLLVTTSPPS